MTAIRNFRLAAGSVASTSNTVVYTVPANNTVILKFAAIHNNSAASATESIYINEPVSGAAILLISQSVAAGASELWSGWTVLNAGDQIRVVNNGAAYYWLAGAILPFG